MQPRTVSTLIDCLAIERGWRIKEISYVATNVKRAEGTAIEISVIRASIPLIYAHWEGFIKSAARTYLQHVELQRLRYIDLLPCFTVLGMKSKINQLAESKKARLNIESVECKRPAAPPFA